MRNRAILWLLLLLLLAGCGGGSEAAPPQSGAPEKTASVQAAAAPSAPPGPTGSGSYRAPAFASSSFHADQATGNGQVLLDLSATSEGYVAVSGMSDKRLKCQIFFGETTYTYDLPGDGTPVVYPLQCGNGGYRLRVMENVVDKKYANIFSTEFDVSLADEFQPFLRPSSYVNYTESSVCVQKAAEFAAAADTALDVVSQVYEYICSAVTYDVVKAETVQSGYLPEPDETLLTGKGICFDYASLAAAMLRSQGIPTKVIFGYVAPGDVYHAWNMFYTAETGWITVSFEVKEGSWNRIDLTFAAGGADSAYIGAGEDYTDLYFY